MWSKPQRLHPLAALITALKLLKDLLLPLLILLISQGLQQQSPLLWILMTCGVVFALVLAWGFISWYRFTYYLTDQDLNVQQGVLVHKKSYIPRERIQGIDLNQGVLQRLFGLVTVQVETAGGNKPEAVLTAVSRRQAEQLRLELLRTKDLLSDQEQGRHDSLTKKIHIRRLILLGATSGSGLGLVLSLFSGIWAMLNNAGLDWESYFIWIWQRWDTLQVVPVVLLFLWLLALLGMVLKYGGFTLTRHGDRLQINYGFLQERQVSIPVKRIQAVRLVEGVLRQPWGYGTLEVESAGYGLKGGEKVVLWPLAHKKELNSLLEEFLPEFARQVPLQGLPARAKWRYIRRSLLQVAIVVLPVTVFLYHLYGAKALYALCLLPLAVIWGYLKHRDAGWGLHGEMLALRYRNLARTSLWTPRPCVQFMNMGYTPFQGRANLRTFNIGLASRANFGLVDISRKQGEQLMTWYRPFSAHLR